MKVTMRSSFGLLSLIAFIAFAGCSGGGGGGSGSLSGSTTAPSTSGSTTPATPPPATTPPSTTPPVASGFPIDHVFIIFKENHTFDNYFGSYPGANGVMSAKISTGSPLKANFF